jgi:NADPH2:quinone reductase
VTHVTKPEGQRDDEALPEVSAVEVPEDLDPAEVLSLVLTYITAYQLLHRTA